jgi:hypothetical protein
MTLSRRLTLGDIADQRAYERERDAFRTAVIELKRRRRVALGTVVTLVFENRETIRFQIQEMARVERLTTDAAIQEELDTYNPIVPEPGELRATLFIELTTEEQMREWLPRLVGIERALEMRLPNGDVVGNTVDAQHARQLTREEVTAAVHYVGFQLTAEQVAAFGDGAVLCSTHPAYREEVVLRPETVAELRRDLLPDT